MLIDMKKITYCFVGARSASSIVNEAMNVLKQTVDDRLAGRGGSRGKVQKLFMITSYCLQENSNQRFHEQLSINI